MTVKDGTNIRIILMRMMTYDIKIKYESLIYN